MALAPAQAGSPCCPPRTSRATLLPVGTQPPGLSPAYRRVEAMSPAEGRRALDCGAGEARASDEGRVRPKRPEATRERSERQKQRLGRHTCRAPAHHCPLWTPPGQSRVSRGLVTTTGRRDGPDRSVLVPAVRAVRVGRSWSAGGANLRW